MRNDTGVYEGGEISMFYDPMIAKLCTWAPDRAAAIAAMSDALDAFEVDGIGHNLPFLSAVMEHPRFRKGEITTAFIAEEWPDGFAGVNLPQESCAALAAIAAACNFIEKQRAARISGVMENHRHHVGADWVASIGGHDFPLTVARDGENLLVTHAGGEPLAGRYRRLAPRAEPDARPCRRPSSARCGSRRGRMATGCAIAAPICAASCAPRARPNLLRLMPVKKAADTSRLLLCPMPGLVVSIAVSEGDEVQEGQPLATVEAMKMENILRAERKARVKKINAKPGDSLAVDEVIMEFE